MYSYILERNIVRMNHQYKSSARKQFIPTRLKNEEYRSREYLTESEVQILIELAESGRKHKERNSLIILMLFRHGLRISELCNLKWNNIMWSDKKIHINRSKNGISGIHPLKEDELEQLKQLKEINDKYNSEYVFFNERGGQLDPQAITRLVKRLGEKSDFGFNVHPHQLRHACGYYLANKGFTTRDIQAYLGHKNIQNTEKYTTLNTERFNNFF